MKTLQLNKGLEIKVCETLDDINIKRFVSSKTYVLMKETGMDFPKLEEFFAQQVKAFDEKSSSQMLIGLYDFVKSLRTLKENEDAEQMIFALITLIDGEDPENTDKTILKEKLEVYAKHGLTQGVIRHEVELFLLAFRIR